MKKLITTLIILISVISLFGCRTAEDHYRLFEKKGGKIDPVEKEILVPVTIPGKDGKDSTIYVNVLVPCPEIETPKTNSETRQENRTERKRLKFLQKRYEDSLSTLLKIHKEEMKLELKKARIGAKVDIKQSKDARKVSKTKIRQENKSRWWIWLLVGTVLGAIIENNLRRLKGKFFTKTK